MKPCLEVQAGEKPRVAHPIKHFVSEWQRSVVAIINKIERPVIDYVSELAFVIKKEEGGPERGFALSYLFIQDVFELVLDSEQLCRRELVETTFQRFGLQIGLNSAVEIALGR